MLRVLPVILFRSRQVRKTRVCFKTFHIFLEKRLDVSGEINTTAIAEFCNKNIDKFIIDDFAFVMFLLPPGVGKVEHDLLERAVRENERRNLRDSSGNQFIAPGLDFLVRT